ncbi:MAG: tetratricopeptide repeat protein [Anaerolineales bacterium]|nr:tetratricopeptide repeat protein [Anaerolineales bacterium]
MIEQNQELKNLLSKGNSAAWDQTWGDAASYYQQALEIDPENFKAILNLGLAYFEMHDYAASLESYSKAIGINSDDPAPYEKMYLIYKEIGKPAEAVKAALYAAESHLKNEDIQKAIENWKRVVEIDIQNVKAHVRLAMVYQRLGKNKLAISEYIHSASLLQFTGNTKKAAEAIERALQFSPENIIVLRAKEILHQGRQLPLPEPIIKEPEEDLVVDIAQLEPPKLVEQKEFDNPIAEAVDHALIVLAGALFEEAIFDKESKPDQERDLDSALSWNIDGETDLTDDSLQKLHVSQAIEYYSSGNETEASDNLKSAIDDGYNNPAAYFLLGYLYIQLGRMESASRSLIKSVSHSEFALGSRLLLASYYNSIESWMEASKEYLEALRIADISLVENEDVEDLIQLYEVMMDDLESQEEDEAFIKMSKHIEGMLLRSDWKEILTDMRGKDAGEGGTLLPKMDGLLDDRRSQMINVHRNILDLAEEGHYEAAMEKAFFALRNSPTFLPLHVTIGDILMEQNKISGAVTKYLAVADVYTVQGKTERALAMLEKVIELQPMNIEIRQRYIDLLEEYGKKEEAIIEYINIADVFYPLAELDSARSAYSKALVLAKTIPGDTSWRIKLHQRLADIDIQRLDWESALQTYVEIGELLPQNQKTSITIVDLNYRLGNDPAAEKEIDRFTKQFDPESQMDSIKEYLVHLKEEKPDEAYIARQLVSLYKHLGLMDQAISELDNLGDMLLEAGRKQDAVQVIQEIISFSPSNIEDYQKLLEQLHN